MGSKSVVKSKTVWINVLGGIAAVAGTVGGVIPANKAPYVMAAGAIANVILRLLTSQPVSVAGDPQ